MKSSEVMKGRFVRPAGVAFSEVVVPASELPKLDKDTDGEEDEEE